MKDKSVLVVDDDKEIRDTFTEALGLEDIPVMTASNGQEGLTLLLGLAPENYPCVIILDWMMPVMNGAGFLEAIKEHTHLHSIPIIIATARGNSGAHFPENIARVQKPIDLEQLYTLINKYRFP